MGAGTGVLSPLRFVIATLVSAVGLGCPGPSPDVASTAAPEAATGEAPTPGLFVDQILQVGGSERSYDIFIPELDVADLGKAPAILLLHGNGGSASQLLGRGGETAPFKRWLTLAEQHRFFLLLPNGNLGPGDKRGWNDCRSDATTNPQSDDVAFVDSLIDVVVGRFDVDPGAVFATGISNGGHFALRLAIERPARVRAVGVVAASMPAETECGVPTTPVSVLFLNGTEDPICPFGGGFVGGEASSGRGSVVGSPASIALWREVNGLVDEGREEPLPDTDSADESTVSRLRYRSSFPTVEALHVVGGGHTEPSLVERYRPWFLQIVGRQNGDVEMADEVWSFFSSQRAQAP